MTFTLHAKEKDLRNQFMSAAEKEQLFMRQTLSDAMLLEDLAASNFKFPDLIIPEDPKFLSPSFAKVEHPTDVLDLLESAGVKLPRMKF